MTFPVPVALGAADYWLGFIAGTGGMNYFADVITNARIYRAETYSSSPADPFGGGTTTDGFRLAVYATYDPLSSGAANDPPFGFSGRGAGW